jgi:hypothetical protein
MVTLTLSSLFKPPLLKRKERAYKLENDSTLNMPNSIFIVSFVNLEHNHSSNHKYEHRMANYIEDKILDDKPFSFTNKDY